MVEAFVAQNPDCAQPTRPAQIRLKWGSSRPTLFTSLAHVRNLVRPHSAIGNLAQSIYAELSAPRTQRVGAPRYTEGLRAPTRCATERSACCPAPKLCSTVMSDVNRHSVSAFCRTRRSDSGSPVSSRSTWTKSPLTLMRWNFRTGRSTRNILQLPAAVQPAAAAEAARTMARNPSPST